MKKNWKKTLSGIVYCIFMVCVIAVLMFFIVGCDEPYPKEKQDKNYVYTDEGYYTGCKRVKVDNKEYFRCSVHGGFVLTPVVK